MLEIHPVFYHLQYGRAEHAGGYEQDYAITCVCVCTKANEAVSVFTYTLHEHDGICHFVGCKIKRKKGYHIVPVWDYLGHTIDREIFTFCVKNFRVVNFRG